MGHAWKDILINVFFIIFPLFLYQILSLDRFHITKKQNKLIIASFSAISIFLCMSFPSIIIPGYHFDLRFIPFILASLYCGFPTAVVLAIEIIGYRFLLGGTGSLANLVIYGSMLPIIYIILPHYKGFTMRSKLLVTTSLAFSTSVFSNLLYLIFCELPIFMIFVAEELILMKVIIALLVTFMVERIRENTVLREMINRAEKLRVVSEMAASVSHEIRNPLTVTRGFIQLLLKADLPKGKRDEFLQLSLEELDRAGSIITDYLTLAKPQLSSIVTLNVSDEIKYVLDVMAPYATMHNVELHKELNELCIISGDRQKLHQCLINLVKNGIEAMPDGGTLSICNSFHNQMAVIEITDSGTGMTAEQIARLGTPYYSTKDKGTGLGTMVAFSIVHAFNGKVSINSVYGKGTKFTLSFPGSCK
ncbi:ATP-binding protein [Brevibacillus sp. SYSU BS000544]|uniref:ATP-binding protein n=1 Tax=Brevibacillus sp. SYSU BS000544 TaxID=3416443 RepID=UPI003CE518BC